MQDNKIIHKPTEEEPFVIVHKKEKFHSAPLSPDETDNVVYEVSRQFPEILSVHGRKEIEKGLLHRLDFETEGLILLAANQFFYDFLLKEQEEGKFIKTYTAFCNKDFSNSEKLAGFPPLSQICDLRTEKKVISYFRNYGLKNSSVRPVTEESGKAALKKLGNKTLYETNIFCLDAEKLKFSCHLNKGYRHQVRCHLAWLGFPVRNDPLYNAAYSADSDQIKKERQLEFYATGLQFVNPVNGKLLIYSIQK